MQLTCPECSTSYAATPEALGEAGRKVKCHKCGNVWFATPDDLTEQAIEPAPETEHEAIGAGQGAASMNSDDDMSVAMTGDVEEADFDDLEGGGDTDDSMLTSADVEADAAWDSVLADVGLQGNTIEDDGTDVLDMLDNPSPDPHRKKRNDDIETLASQRGGSGRKTKAGALTDFGPRSLMSGPARPLAIAVLIAFAIAGTAAGLFFARTQVVEVLPGMARIYAAVGYPVNLRGLEFRNVTFEQGVENGLPVLAIRGEVVNITDRALPVPEIRFALRNDGDLEIYHWTGKAKVQELPAAGSATFLTRLATPPAAAASVQLRFVGRARNSGKS